MKISKYTKLGILIVFAMSSLIWGLSYLKGHDIFRKNMYYNVVYPRIDGLNESNKVMMNGYQIGQVDKIRFLPDNSGKLLVTIMVDATFRIPVNSVAQIISSDIMGTREVKMILSDENEIYESNDTIPGSVEGDLKEQVSLQVLPIKNKAEQLLGTIDSAITILTVVFNEDARDNLTSSFENFNHTISNLNKTTSDLQQIVSNEKGSIERIITNLDEISTALKGNIDNLNKTLKNISIFSDSLSNVSVTPVIRNISNASEQILAILEKINSDQNSAGLLLNDDELYHSINKLSLNLSSLINDIQDNPKRYLHFSAIDLGKNVYISGIESSVKLIVFKVYLISSENRIVFDSKLFEGLGTVEEYETSGAFTYLLGNTNSYSDITKLLATARRTFPDANIIAFRNGRMVSLDKALKTTKN